MRSAVIRTALLVVLSGLVLAQAPAACAGTQPGQFHESPPTNAQAFTTDGMPGVMVWTDGKGGIVAANDSVARNAGVAMTCTLYELANANVPFGSLPITDKQVLNPQQGQHYFLHCINGPNQTVFDNFIIYRAADPVDAVLAALQAADLARAQLDLPLPVIKTSPDGAQLVGLKTWYWITQGWETQQRSAQVAGVTAAVNATPFAVTWAPGDNQSKPFDCFNPGKPWNPNRPEDDETDCGYVYARRSTVKGPNNTFALTATVHYHVFWTTNAGQPIELPDIARTTTIPLLVQEVQAVINAPPRSPTRR
jgi:hypothetical protein